VESGRYNESAPPVRTPTSTVTTAAVLVPVIRKTPSISRAAITAITAITAVATIAAITIETAIAAEPIVETLPKRAAAKTATAE
jgi:hypothetical protein